MIKYIKLKGKVKSEKKKKKSDLQSTIILIA